MVFPRAQYWVPFCIPCTPHPSQTSPVNKNMNHHFYAHDSQIYLSFKPSAAGEPNTSKQRIESWIHDVNNWMSANKLMLNHNKTELLVLHARQRQQPPLESIFVCSDVISTHRTQQRTSVRGSRKQHMSVCFLPPAQHCSNQ